MGTKNIIIVLFNFCQIWYCILYKKSFLSFLVFFVNRPKSEIQNIISGACENLIICNSNGAASSMPFASIEAFTRILQLIYNN